MALELSEDVELRLRQQAWRARKSVSEHVSHLVLEAWHPQQDWLPGYAHLTEDEAEETAPVTPPRTAPNPAAPSSPRR